MISPSTAENFRFVVGAEGNGQRLDRYLAETVLSLSRNQLTQRLLWATINGKKVKVSRIIIQDDIIELALAPIVPLDLIPENVELTILFENEHVLVLNKQAGVVVHPAAGNYTGTLVHGLLFHFNELKDHDFEDDSRPGIVHRLDKDTSGVLIVAKNPASHEFLAAQFQARTTIKTYIAIGVGNIRFEKRKVVGFLRRDSKNRQRFVHDERDGKSASTDFEMLASKGNFSLLKAHPFTGRTHQIRVHARQLGLPLLGDMLYGKPVSGFLNTRLMLHARTLEIILPGETVARCFSAPIPVDMQDIAGRIGFLDTLKTL